ncbi:MAG: hypothetical protein ACRD2Z_12840 [Thermoanaerobaculia bacterium]
MLQGISRGRAAATVLAGCGFAAILGGTSFSGERFTNDTAQYFSVADNLRAGRGLATSVIYYEEHYASGTVPAPQTVFPPGYPVAIALVAATGVATPTAAFLIDLFSLGVSIWLLFSIALARGHGPASALGGAAAFACLALPWVYTHEMLSEPLFIALTLAGTRWLVGPQRQPAYGPPLLAGVAAAAAITVRYVGVFFAAAVAVVLAVELIRRRSRRTLIHGVAFALPVVVATLTLFWRNARLVGDFRGGNAHEVLKPLGGVLYTALKSTASLLGVGLRLGPVELATLIALALIAALALRARGQVSFALDALAAAMRDRAALLTAVYPLVSIAALLHLERTSSIGFYERMLVPLVPFAFLFALEAARTVKFGRRAPCRLARVTLVAVAVAYLAGQAHVARAAFASPPRASMIASALAEPLGETTVGDWLRARATAEHPLFGNEPQLLGAVLGRPVVGLTASQYSPRTWTAEAALRLIRAYGVEHVVLFPGPLSAGRAEDRLPVLAALAAGVVPSWLTPVHVSGAVHVYRVRTSDVSGSDPEP